MLCRGAQHPPNDVQPSRGTPVGGEAMPNIMFVWRRPALSGISQGDRDTCRVRFEATVLVLDTQFSRVDQLVLSHCWRLSPRRCFHHGRQLSVRSHHRSIVELFFPGVTRLPMGAVQQW
mmetsp:Transcript_66010/g.151184  ORF Transcript_66010/g.151184 Transcript_66010/m.151184 type:complete len:119 (+) Transcript_66010:1098-1454(+)